MEQTTAPLVGFETAFHPMLQKNQASRSMQYVSSDLDRNISTQIPVQPPISFTLDTPLSKFVSKVSDSTVNAAPSLRVFDESESGICSIMSSGINQKTVSCPVTTTDNSRGTCFVETRVGPNLLPEPPTTTLHCNRTLPVRTTSNSPNAMSGHAVNYCQQKSVIQPQTVYKLPSLNIHGNTLGTGNSQMRETHGCASDDASYTQYVNTHQYPSIDEPVNIQQGLVFDQNGQDVVYITIEDDQLVPLNPDTHATELVHYSVQPESASEVTISNSLEKVDEEDLSDNPTINFILNNEPICDILQEFEKESNTSISPVKDKLSKKLKQRALQSNVVKSDHRQYIYHTYSDAALYGGLNPIELCTCPDSVDREEVPEEQVFIVHGQMFRLQDATLIKIGHVQLHAFLKNSSLFVPYILLVNVFEIPVEKRFKKALYKHHASLNFANMMENDVELIRQKYNLRIPHSMKYLLDLRSVRAIAKLLSKDLDDQVIQVLANNTLLVKVSSSKVKCSQCGFNITTTQQQDEFAELDLAPLSIEENKPPLRVQTITMEEEETDLSKTIYITKDDNVQQCEVNCVNYEPDITPTLTDRDYVSDLDLEKSEITVLDNNESSVVCESFQTTNSSRSCSTPKDAVFRDLLNKGPQNTFEKVTQFVKPDKIGSQPKQVATNESTEQRKNAFDHENQDKGNLAEKNNCQTYICEENISKQTVDCLRHVPSQSKGCFKDGFKNVISGTSETFSLLRGEEYIVPDIETFKRLVGSGQIHVSDSHHKENNSVHNISLLSTDEEDLTYNCAEKSATYVCAESMKSNLKNVCHIQQNNVNPTHTAKNKQENNCENIPEPEVEEKMDKVADVTEINTTFSQDCSRNVIPGPSETYKVSLLPREEYIVQDIGVLRKAIGDGQIQIASNNHAQEKHSTKETTRSMVYHNSISEPKQVNVQDALSQNDRTKNLIYGNEKANKQTDTNQNDKKNYQRDLKHTGFSEINKTNDRSLASLSETAFNSLSHVKCMDHISPIKPGLCVNTLKGLNQISPIKPGTHMITVKSMDKISPIKSGTHVMTVKSTNHSSPIRHGTGIVIMKNRDHSSPIKAGTCLSYVNNMNHTSPKKPAVYSDGRTLPIHPGKGLNQETPLLRTILQTKKSNSFNHESPTRQLSSKTQTQLSCSDGRNSHFRKSKNLPLKNQSSDINMKSPTNDMGVKSPTNDMDVKSPNSRVDKICSKIASMMVPSLNANSVTPLNMLAAIASVDESDLDSEESDILEAHAQHSKGMNYSEEEHHAVEEKIKRFIVFVPRGNGFRVKRFKEGAVDAFPALFSPHPDHPVAKDLRKKFTASVSRWMTSKFTVNRKPSKDAIQTITKYSHTEINTNRISDTNLVNKTISTNVQKSTTKCTHTEMNTNRVTNSVNRKVSTDVQKNKKFLSPSKELGNNQISQNNPVSANSFDRDSTVSFPTSERLKDEQYSFKRQRSTVKHNLVDNQCPVNRKRSTHKESSVNIQCAAKRKRSIDNGSSVNIQYLAKRKRSTDKESSVNIQFPARSIDNEISVNKQCPSNKKRSMDKEISIDKQCPAKRTLSIEKGRSLDEKCSIKEESSTNKENSINKQCPTIKRKRSVNKQCLVIRKGSCDKKSFSSVNEESLTNKKSPVEKQGSFGKQCLVKEKGPMNKESSEDERSSVKEESSTDKKSPVHKRYSVERKKSRAKDNSVNKQCPDKREMSKDNASSISKQGPVNLKNSRDKSQSYVEETCCVKEESPTDKDNLIHRQCPTKRKISTNKEILVNKQCSVKGQRSTEKENLVDKQCSVKGRKLAGKESFVDKQCSVKGQRSMENENLVDKQCSVKERRSKEKESIEDKQCSVKEQGTTDKEISVDENLLVEGETSTEDYILIKRQWPVEEEISFASTYKVTLDKDGERLLKMKAVNVPCYVRLRRLKFLEDMFVQ